MSLYFTQTITTGSSWPPGTEKQVVTTSTPASSTYGKQPVHIISICPTNLKLTIKLIESRFFTILSFFLLQGYKESKKYIAAQGKVSASRS